MRNESRWLAGAVIALALVTVNVSIWQKEQLLKQGAVMIAGFMEGCCETHLHK